MTALTPEELEGRVNAHRELMIDLVAALMGGDRAIERFIASIRDDASYKNHEEDPGVIPTEGLVLEAGMAREIRSIVEAARARHMAANS